MSAFDRTNEENNYQENNNFLSHQNSTLKNVPRVSTSGAPGQRVAVFQNTGASVTKPTGMKLDSNAQNFLLYLKSAYKTRQLSINDPV